MPYVGRELTRGSYLKLDTIADQFNGSKTTFDLQSGGSAFYPGSSTSILVSIGGTVQEPVTQYGVDRSQIVFATPPSNGQSFFAVALGVALATGVPSKHSVGGEELSKPFNYEDGLLYLDSVNDRVGIHTASPSHPFHVVGDMVVDGNIRGNIHNTTGIATFRNIRVDGDLIVDGDTTTLNTTLREVEILHVDANSTAAAGIITQRGVGDVLQLWDGSTNKQHFVVADNGKVGIGSTAVPTADLEIHGGVENPSLVLKRNTGGGDVASIAWHAQNASPSKVAQINYRGGPPSSGMQFYTGGGTSAEQRMLIDLEGKVGIGTRIPQKFLELYTSNPTINVKATANNDASIELIETTSANFGATGTNGFRLRYDGGDNRFYIASGANTTVNNVVSIDRDTGAFGLGIDAPKARLHVNGTTNGLQARFGGEGTGLGVSCFQKTNNNAGVIFHAQDSSHGTFAFRTAGYERLRIASDGYVGINNNSPSTRLDVKQNNGVAYDGKVQNVAYGPARFLNASGHTSGGTYTGFQFNITGDSQNRICSMGMITEASNSRASSLVFATDDNGNRTEKLRITSDGKVGINTVNPQQMLDVRGNVVIGIDQVSGNPGNTTGIATIRGHFVNAEGDFARLSFSNSLSASGAATRSSASIRGLRLGDNLGTGLAFWTNPTSGANPGVERLRITEEGKVGINQDTPTAELEVAPVGTGTSSTIFINAPTHNTNVVSEAALKFGYGHSGGQAVGYIKLNESGGNSFDGSLTIGVPYNKGGGEFGTRDVMNIKNSGKVGINTSLPHSDLQIITAGSSYQDGTLKIGGSNTELGLVLDYDQSGSTTARIYANADYNSSTSVLKICSDLDDNPNQLVLEGTGNIGIGESSPDKHLHISSLSEGSNPATIRLTDTDTGAYTGHAIGLIEFETLDSNDAGVNAFIGAYHADQAGNSNLQFHVGNAGSTATALTLQPDKTASFYGGIYQALEDTSTDWASRGNPIAFNNVETGVTVRNSSGTDGCFTGFSGVVFNANDPARWQTASFLVKSVSGTGYAPEVYLTRRTDSAETTTTLKIDTNGHVLIGGTAGVDDLTGGVGQKGLVIGSTGEGNAGIAIINSTTGTGRIYFGDATGNNAARKRGQISYAHNDTVTSDYMSFSTAADERLRITSGGNVNIGGNYTQTTYTMRVTGSFAATTKSFVIDHPTKENHKLRYACLEGPENSVYVRGRSSDPVIELPEYWVGLVHDDSITVNVTPIGNKNVWVESINNNSVTIGSDDSTEYFYTVFAERKDVEKLEVEVEN